MPTRGWDAQPVSAHYCLLRYVAAFVAQEAREARHVSIAVQSASDLPANLHGEAVRGCADTRSVGAEPIAQSCALPDAFDHLNVCLDTAASIWIGPVPGTRDVGRLQASPVHV